MLSSQHIKVTHVTMLRYGTVRDCRFLKGWVTNQNYTFDGMYLSHISESLDKRIILFQLSRSKFYTKKLYSQPLLCLVVILLSIRGKCVLRTSRQGRIYNSEAHTNIRREPQLPHRVEHWQYPTRWGYFTPPFCVCLTELNNTRRAESGSGQRAHRHHAARHDSRENYLGAMSAKYRGTE